MPPRRALYDPFQTDADVQQARAKANKPQPAAPADKVAESPPPEYHIAPAWIDTAGRTRTWSLRDPHGTQMAEITTKSAAQKLAQLLNSVADERGPAR